MTNKVIVVGASSGIGRALAIKYLAKGCLVGITGRRIDLLEEVRELYPDQVFISSFDVADRKGTLESLQGLCEKMGGLDTIIYNSGYGKSTDHLDGDIEYQTAQVNVSGFISSACFAFDYFVKNKINGHIVATSSVAAIRGFGASPSYSATKRFMFIYMEALEQKSRALGMKIFFTTIVPGFINTDFISGKSYPMTMEKEYAYTKIFTAIQSKKRNAIIDWRWAIVVFFCKLIPTPLWVRLKIKKS